MHQNYFKESLKAVDAKFKAQEIAFAPMTFQVAKTLRDSGILETLAEKGENGSTINEVAETLDISKYGVGVLLEMGLGMELVKLVSPDEPLRFILGKVGFFIIEDKMTRVNMDFTNDVCYKGAFSLEESIRKGKPEGLKVFGEWKTVYDGLSSLSEDVQKSWFAFDHFYSDVAFPEALPIVYDKKPARLFDIGGNTAKWAITSCKYDTDVKVTIFDLPGQIEMAKKLIAEEELSDRIDTVAVNVLSDETVFPSGADAVWMSQFLDCFSLDEVEAILRKVEAAVDKECDVYVLEPLWDKQRFEAASYSLQATSVYFTCIANGNSKMYRSGELIDAISAAGFEFKDAHHNLGANAYSLLRFRKK
ncbi:MAG: class I SAM-dependent methyltransferase [Spirochaetales bacterium]|nr:class I SAM-dependent methyltransferase [Spirochaetales bacterium]